MSTDREAIGAKGPSDPQESTEYDNILKKDYKMYYDDKIQFIRRQNEKINLVLQTNKKFLDISEEVCNKYKIKVYTQNQIERDFIQFFCKEFCDLVNIKGGIERCTDDYNFIENRMKTRILLYRNCWNIPSIEKYVNKNDGSYDKNNFSMLNIDYIETNYINCLILLGLQKNAVIFKGRPNLPPELKDLSKKMHKDRMRKIMEEKYSKINTLFTQEEARVLIFGIDNFYDNMTTDDKTNLKNKIKKLTQSMQTN